MANYQTLLRRATRLPAISFTLKNDCDEDEPIEILHRRFDELFLKLEKFEREVLSLTHRPARIIPFTGAVTGLVKHCRHLKQQRAGKDNYLYYIAAYNIVYDQLRLIADLAKQLAFEGPNVPPLVLDVVTTKTHDDGLTVKLD